MTSRRKEGGFTLTELMISVLLAAIATGFAFAVYARASQASRAQARVAETQQALRAASQLLAADLRQAGYLAGVIQSAASGLPLKGFTAQNGAGGYGSDIIQLVYADLSVYSRVDSPNPPFNAAVSEVDNIDGWSDGDVAIAVKVSGNDRGKGCILKITALVPGGPKLQHNPGAGGAPWNQPGNTQCSAIAGTWADGQTIFTKFIARAYRIKPNDPRGVLQASPTGMLIANDWVDIALGIIDLQVAVYVHDPNDPADRDGDGEPEDWYSGNTMAAALDSPTASPLEVRVTLLAKSIAPSGAPRLPATPSFINPAMPVNHNDWSDRGAVALPVADATSPYYGDNLYRWSSFRIDLRNLGIGLGANP